MIERRSHYFFLLSVLKYCVCRIHVRALKECSKRRVTKFFYRRGCRGQSAALLYLQGQRTAYARGYALGHFEARFLYSVGNIRQFHVLQYVRILSAMNTNDRLG